VIRSPKSLALAFIVAFGTLASGWQTATDKITAIPLTMPNKAGSLKFGVLATSAPANRRIRWPQMARLQSFTRGRFCGDNLHVRAPADL
jgi:hypothetical protein